jgi:DNA-binding NarL/FixJ family response regulator
MNSMQRKARTIMVGQFGEGGKILEVLHEMKNIVITGLICSGIEAVNICASSLPDLILISVITGDISGFETARWILEQYKEAKVIMISTEYNEQFLRASIDTNSEAYIPVYAGKKNLKEVIGALVSKSIKHNTPRLTEVDTVFQ